MENEIPIGLNRAKVFAENGESDGEEKMKGISIRFDIF